MQIFQNFLAIDSFLLYKKSFDLEGLVEFAWSLAEYFSKFLIGGRKKVGETIGRGSTGNGTGTTESVQRIGASLVFHPRPVKSIVHLRARRIIPVASRIGKPGIYYASVAPDSWELGDRYQTLSDSHQLSANSIGKWIYFIGRAKKPCQKFRLVPCRGFYRAISTRSVLWYCLLFRFLRTRVRREIGSVDLLKSSLKAGLVLRNWTLRILDEKGNLNFRLLRHYRERYPRELCLETTFFFALFSKRNFDGIRVWQSEDAIIHTGYRDNRS